MVQRSVGIFVEKSAKKTVLRLLGEIKKPNRPIYREVNHIRYIDKIGKFISSAKSAGAKVYRKDELFKGFETLYGDARIIVDTTQNIKIEFKNLQNVDLTIIKAEFGIAENGAVWIEWNDELHPRALLSISKYLIVTLKESRILDNISQAYSLIDFSRVSYGLFLSGPSKTADIEQSLVLGAHGAIELKVLLV
jgi:L-lactate dehydrogenase complex protein LldG